MTRLQNWGSIRLIGPQLAQYTHLQMQPSSMLYQISAVCGQQALHHDLKSLC